ncbi:hypothetical protein V5N11_034947 [Cardamine amara subsp. amara]|uniref:Endonuclease/exonuclease/phosphatase domain-containing protein n=1 Tax=Cardamine amara subsp. amara TaxID=228776 RepID=A0ABD1BAZ7_CARAN
METKNPDAFVLKELNWMGFSNYSLVSPHSPGGGGLALFWKQEIKIEISSANHNFIDTVIKYKNTTFNATFVYGEPDHTKRKDVWEQLTMIAEARASPWYLTGDFNDIIDNSEKS